MPTVELRFSPLAAHVRTARLIAASVGRRSGVDESLVDEVKLAVGEACARAVALHEEHDVDADVVMTLTDDGPRFSITVQDQGPGGASTDAGDPDELVESAGPGSALPPDFALAVIVGLVDDTEIVDNADGTLVRMSWPRPVDA